MRTQSYVAALALWVAPANAFAPRVSPLLKIPSRISQTGPRLVFPVDAVDVTAVDALAGSASAAASAAHGSLTGIQDIGGTLLAFSDQGGNLAGKFFMGSLPPYLAFLYFLGYEKNRSPQLMQFGFAYLLLFVAATIPTGIISKSTFGLSLADVDWLHGSAELLLTVSNVMVVLGLRAALLDDAQGPVVKGDPLTSQEDSAAYSASTLPLRAGALVIAASVAAFCASGVGALGLGPHDGFLGGIGALPAEAVAGLAHAEPENALSIPTWAVHVSSVAEFVFAINLVWKYAEATGNEKWKGLAWGMVPSHASGVAACTYHFFFNAKAVVPLVTLQAFLTLLGNITLALACFRLAISNGWTLEELDPRLLLDDGRREARSAEASLMADQWRNYALADAAAAAAEIIEEEVPPPQAAANPLNAFFASFGGATAAAAALPTESSNSKAAAAAQAAAEAAAAESLALRTQGLESEPLLFAKLAAVTIVGAYVVKYGELGLDLPFSEHPETAAAAVCLTPPLALMATLTLTQSPNLSAKLNLPSRGDEDGSTSMASLSMADVKKFGVAGTLAYVLTELAFWAVAFPVASYALYNTQGHWPDWGSNSDRATVLGFIFAGANVARLLVPLRFGAALALAPWCDENIIKKFEKAE